MNKGANDRPTKATGSAKESRGSGVDNLSDIGIVVVKGSKATLAISAEGQWRGQKLAPCRRSVSRQGIRAGDVVRINGIVHQKGDLKIVSCLALRSREITPEIREHVSRLGQPAVA